MFTTRKTIGNIYHWDRNFISALKTDLEKGGYIDVSIKLPFSPGRLYQNLEISSSADDIKQALNEDLLHASISIDEFLEIERNFPAVIFIAINPDKKETIKILFINSSKKMKFLDDTFPSVDSAQSQIFTQSPDPARIVPLSDFLYAHLMKSSQSNAGTNIQGIIAFGLLIIQVMTVVSTGSGILNTFWNLNFFYDIIIGLGTILFLYNYQTSPRGLSVNDRETQTVDSFVRRIVVGDFKDNVLVNIVITILVSIVTAFVLKWIDLN